MDYQLVLKFYDHKRAKSFLAVMFPQEDIQELFTKDDVWKTCYFDYELNCLKTEGDDNCVRPLLLRKFA